MKRIFCTALTAWMALGCAGGVAGAVDAVSVETMSAEEAAIYEKTGMHLISLTDAPVNYTSPYAVAPNPADEIQARTGMRLISLTDAPVQYTPVTLDEGATVYAVSRPTKEAESYPYEQSWTGTSNYTFTNRYFDVIKGGRFDASATGKFYADFYYKDGTYMGGMAAVKSGNRYEVRSSFDTVDRGYYYVILTNQSGSPSKNAYYKASQVYD